MPSSLVADHFGGSPSALIADGLGYILITVIVVEAGGGTRVFKKKLESKIKGTEIIKLIIILHEDFFK